jgi:hypothetical protein
MKRGAEALTVRLPIHPTRAHHPHTAHHHGGGVFDVGKGLVQSKHGVGFLKSLLFKVSGVRCSPQTGGFSSRAHCSVKGMGCQPLIQFLMNI